MTPEERKNLLGRMDAMLRRGRLRIEVAQFTACLRDMAGIFISGLLILSSGFLLLRLMAMGLHQPLTVEASHVFLILLVFGAALFGCAVLVVLLRRPVTVQAAAERLDLSQSTHNRIATAIEFLRANDDSPFANLAISEGLEHLERLQSEHPHVESHAVAWRRIVASLALSMLMIAAGQCLGTAPYTATFVASHEGGVAGPAPKSTSGPTLPEVRTDLNLRPETARPKPSAGSSPKADPGSDRAKDIKRSDAKRKTEADGSIAQNASGKANGGQSSSSSGRSSGTGGAKSDAGKSDSNKPGKPKKPNESTASPSKVDEDEKKGGSIDTRGSSGAESKQNTQNDWANKVKGESNDNDDAHQEDEPEGEADPSKQRLGVQPALKSRASQVSRELSLATGFKKSNEANRGRGGPSAPKKSRGTATMIMGVPVPGFVKGSLLPGPSRSTQEEVTPRPGEGPDAGAFAWQPGVGQETPVERYRPAPEMAARARDYLMAIHADREVPERGNQRKGNAEEDD